VVVASSQVRTLTADVRKVFNAIAFSIELVDLKSSPNWSIRNDLKDHFHFDEKEKG
jgi:hypothetical protein